jgi:superfamily II DNA or RNA helicase
MSLINDTFYKYPAYQLKDILKQHVPDIKGVYKMRKLDVINSLIKNKYRASELPPIVKRPPYEANILKRYGTKTFTDQEQSDFLNQSYQVIDPLKAKKQYLNPKTGNLELIELQKHQRDFISGFINSNFTGAILFHGVGTGKTLSAVAYSHYYLTLYPSHKVVIISPPALLHNSIQGLIQYGLNIQDKRYSFLTYIKFSNSPSKYVDNKTLLIIDEAHNFRTYITASPAHDPEGKPLIDKNGDAMYNVSSNKRGHATLQGCKKAHKVLAMTGTPFINGLYDIENLLSMIEQKDPLGRDMFASIVTNDKSVKDYFKYRISYYENSKGNEFFPKVSTNFIPIIMTEDEVKKYEAVDRGDTGKLDEDEDTIALTLFGGKEYEQLKSFYNATRQYCEFLGSKKIDYIIKQIKEKKTQSIIYTTYINVSLNFYKQTMDKLGIKYSVIAGGISSNEKENARQKFNKKEVQVLLISKAGTEGVDTIGCRDIYIVETLWNEALTEQAIARAVRFKSHYHLPKEEQHVNVYRLIMCKGEEDVKLVNMMHKDASKSSSTISYNAILKKLRKNTTDAQKQIKLLEWSKKKLNDNQIKELKPGERALYYETRKFNRYQVENDLRKLFKEKPCVELYVAILSLSKQSQIINFIKEIDKNIPSIEDYESPIKSQVTKMLNDGEDIKDILKLQQEQLTKEKVNLRQALIEPDSDLSVRLEKAKAFNIKKHTVGVLQEFFTPPKVVKLLVDASEQLLHGRSIHILEPTAGSGNIVQYILKQKKYKNIQKIDMVEISPNNRKILKELVDLLPSILTLHDEGDFLRFMTPERYDLVIMNPPFHLRKSLMAHLDRDYYDMDFVMKAYSFLKVGGELIALVGDSALNREPYKQWLTDHNAVIQRFTTEWEASKEKGSQSKISKINLAIIVLIRGDEKINDVILERTDKEDEIKDQIMNGNITISEAVIKSKKSR